MEQTHGRPARGGSPVGTLLTALASLARALPTWWATCIYRIQVQGILERQGRAAFRSHWGGRSGRGSNRRASSKVSGEQARTWKTKSGASSVKSSAEGEGYRSSSESPRSNRMGASPPPCPPPCPPSCACAT